MMPKKVQQFIWEGKNSLGQRLNGELVASSAAMARAKLRQQSIVPVRVKRKFSPVFSKRLTRSIIKPVDISLFTRQFSTLISTGTPIVQGLSILAKGTENPTLSSLLLAIKVDVESGSSLSIACRKHHRYFNQLFCNLVAAGELSGQLDKMLVRITTYRERLESLHAKIKKALFYPMVVLIIAFFIAMGLLIFIVPQFEKIFANFGANLPIMTQVILYLSRIFLGYWYFIVGSIGIAIWSFLYAQQKSKKFTGWVQRIVLKILIIGPMIRKSVIARFARTLSITFAAGLPFVDALHAVAGATGNIVYEEATYQIRDRIQVGQQIYQAMQHTGVFPAMVIQMVAVGEESGSLELMLAKVADFFEEELDQAISNLSSLLEPIIMLVLGIIVGGIVIALYMPIFAIGGVM